MLSIDDLDLSKTYTYADYYSWRFEERVELINGEVFTMGEAPGANHQIILGNIAGEMNLFLKDKPQRVFISPFDIRLVKNEKLDNEVKTVVQPDVCVICDLFKIADNLSCLGTPDLVVEVLLPGDNSKEIKIKYDLYEEFGVKEYWLVYPVELCIVKFALNNDGKFEMAGRALTLGDKITTSVLPGFELSLDDVFRNLI